MKTFHHVLILMMAVLVPTGGMAQCPVVIDTTEAYAPNRYQDDFVLTRAGRPVNQFSDVHGRTKYGQWYFFRSNGTVRCLGHFEFGVKQGWWSYYDAKGHLIRREYFKHGQRLCAITVKSGKRREYRYKEHSAAGFKISDSQFW